MLLLVQILLLGGTILSIENALVAILGVSELLRTRLFLIWIFAGVPFASLIHLSMWYAAACVVRRVDGAEEWLGGRRKSYAGDDRQW